MKKVQRILVTGGAGCVGSVLVPQLLLKGYKVRVLDNLTYGGNSLMMNFCNPDFDLLVGDVRNEKTLKKALKGVDAVVHLAAIVGFPACKQNPELAWEVNYEATLLLNKLRKSKLLIFASTSSNYGHVASGYCSEKTPLHPLSVYGKTKTSAEKILIKSPNTIVYRFATAFGLSPRLRLDLLPNDFTFQAVQKGYIKVYERKFKRTFINTRDMARALIFAIENSDKMVGQVYNVGNDSLNISKEGLIDLIRKKIDFRVDYAEFGKDQDQRNYIVDYSKIKSLGFEPTVSMEEGIEEMIRAFQTLRVTNPYSNL